MIVTLDNGKRLYRHVSDCTGYRASKIEIDGVDILDLLDISRRRGDGHFYALMQQLAARFPLDALRPVRIYPPREMLADDIGQYPATWCCGFRSASGDEHTQNCDHYWWDGQPRYTGPI